MSKTCGKTWLLKSLKILDKNFCQDLVWNQGKTWLLKSLKLLDENLCQDLVWNQGNT